MRALLHTGGGLALLLATAGGAAAEPQTFPTPEAATDAVIAALEAADRDGLVAIFGAENEDVILTGEGPQDPSRANPSGRGPARHAGPAAYGMGTDGPALQRRRQDA